MHGHDGSWKQNLMVRTIFRIVNQFILGYPGLDIPIKRSPSIYLPMHLSTYLFIYLCSRAKSSQGSTGSGVFNLADLWDFSKK